MYVLVTSCLWPASIDVRGDDFASARQYHWHQWRGPAADGVAPHGDPPVQWDQETNIRWKAAIPGHGSSTPIVWGDQVFVSAAVETERKVDALPAPAAEPPGGYKTERPANYYRFVVACFDRETGRIRWERTATEEVPHEGHHPTHGYASASPTTDGRFLYVSFGSRGVYCFDMEGNLQWKRDLGDMVTRFGWGEGTSPVICDDCLVVNWDHEGDSSLFLLDAKSGETKWQVDRDEISSWSTPLVVDHKGFRQLIVNATRRVTSYDLATGSIVWECGGQTVNVIPSPVAMDGVVFCMSGFQGSALCAIPLDSVGDLTDSGRIAWQHGRGTPYVPSPLLYDNQLYFTKSNAAVLSCLNAQNGDVLMEETRLPGVSSFYASPVGAAGRVYLVGRDGTALVLKHGPKLEILATNALDDPIDASPAIVGRQIFLRGQSHLYCIALPEAADSEWVSAVERHGQTVRVAGIVLKWIRTDKEANCRRAEALIREAAAGGARLVVTTECFLDGYAIADKSIPLQTYRDLGEPIPDGNYYRRLAALARELKIHLVAGMLEADGELRYNTAVLIDPEGQLVGKYRKQKLEHELVRNTPGDSSPVFETPYGRVGVMICADRREPEIVGRFFENGADFLICPSGGMFGPKRNDPIVQSRSRENKTHIIFVHPAEFLVTGPDGSILDQTILGDVLLISKEDAGGDQDQNRVFYFELPVRARGDDI